MQRFIRLPHHRSDRRVEREPPPVLRDRQLTWCEEPLCVAAGDPHLDACGCRPAYPPPSRPAA
ncbi:MAG: hypothetical protein IT302_10880 [Dehalococcoidia bacterium]|nr:hypothetical protein [Dehalococcoidia bacterium]